MLAAMAKHACKPGLEVYQVASSTVNPFPVSSFKRFMEEHFQEQPFLDRTGKPIRNSKFQLHPDIESYVEALSQVDSTSEVHISVKDNLLTVITFLFILGLISALMLINSN